MQNSHKVSSKLLGEVGLKKFLYYLILIILMGVVSDLIELLIGFVILPKIILFGWILVISSLGVSSVMGALIAPIIILVVLTYLFFNFRRLIAYGLIINILSQILDFVLATIGFNLF